MRRRFSFLLFTFLFLFLFLFPHIVYAKEDIVTCDYTVMVMDFEGEIDDLILKLNATIYDDDSVIFKDIITSKEYTSNKQYSGIYFKDQTKNTDVTITLPKGTDFVKKSKNGNTYKCPSLYSIYEPSISLKISIGEAGNSAENRQFQAVLDNEKVNTSGGNITEVKLLTSKNYCLKAEDKLGSNVEFTFKRHSDGTEELCSKSASSSSESCFKNMSGSNSTKKKTYYFEFIDASFNFDNPPTSLQAGYNEYSNPKFDISVNSLNGYLKTYTMTSEEKCYPDDSDINYDPNNNSDEKIENVCEVLPKAIENYIKQALKLIRWGGLVLMIVLGTLDFVKASAADDQDAIKKAGQNFIKRLIAVIILFLLPILVELILFIAGKIGFNFGECYKVSEF